MKKIITFLLYLISINLMLSQSTLTTIPQVQQWNPSNKTINYKCITLNYGENLDDNQKVLFNRFKEELQEIGACVEKRKSRPTSSQETPMS